MNQTPVFSETTYRMLDAIPGLDKKRQFYHKHPERVTERLLKKNTTLYPSANGKISLCFDIFPFAFDLFQQGRLIQTM